MSDLVSLQNQEIKKQSELVIIRCPICQNDNTRPFIIFGPRDIVKCQECGLVYVNPQRSIRSISIFFEDLYQPDHITLEREFGVWRQPSLQRDARIIKSIISSGRILDVGCSGGEFLSLFPNENWERYGIEPSMSAATLAEKRGITVYRNVLQSASVNHPDGYFDVVTCLDTLMVSPTPVEDLRKIRRFLSDDGIFVIEIPSLPYRLLRNIGPVSLLVYRKWCHLSSASQHLYYFSDNTLRRLLQLCGFRVDRMIVGRPALRDSWWMIIANQLYYAISYLIYMITFGRLNIAARVVYVCRKK